MIKYLISFTALFLFNNLFPMWSKLPEISKQTSSNQRLHSIVGTIGPSSTSQQMTNPLHITVQSLPQVNSHSIQIPLQQNVCCKQETFRFANLLTKLNINQPSLIRSSLLSFARECNFNRCINLENTHASVLSSLHKMTKFTNNLEFKRLQCLRSHNVHETWHKNIFSHQLTPEQITYTVNHTSNFTWKAAMEIKSHDLAVRSAELGRQAIEAQRVFVDKLMIFERNFKLETRETQVKTLVGLRENLSSITTDLSNLEKQSTNISVDKLIDCELVKAKIAIAERVINQENVIISNTTSITTTSQIQEKSQQTQVNQVSQESTLIQGNQVNISDTQKTLDVTRTGLTLDEAKFAEKHGLLKQTQTLTSEQASLVKQLNKLSCNIRVFAEQLNEAVKTGVIKSTDKILKAVVEIARHPLETIKQSNEMYYKELLSDVQNRLSKVNDQTLTSTSEQIVSGVCEHIKKQDFFDKVEQTTEQIADCAFFTVACLGISSAVEVGSVALNHVVEKGIPLQEAMEMGLKEVGAPTVELNEFLSKSTSLEKQGKTYKLIGNESMVQQTSQTFQKVVKNESNCLEANCYTQQTKEQLLKSKQSIEKLILEHEAKLENYKANPDLYDNQGILKNTKSSTIRDEIIKGRINTLQKQIKGQKARLKQIEDTLKQKV